MPQSGTTNNARTRLADVLADIRSSRAEQFGGQDDGPTPAKRRAAVNYVELSGGARHSRTSTAKTSLNNSKVCTPEVSNHTITSRRTYNLRLFDRSIDLTTFASENNDSDGGKVALYPLCRAWVDENGSKKDTRVPEQQPPPHLVSSDQLNATQPSNHRSPIKQALRRSDKNETSNSPSASSTPDMGFESAPAADVHGFPSPTPNVEVLKRFGLESDNANSDLRIPRAVQQFKPADDLERTFDKTFNTMARHECLQLNRERWRDVRKMWSETSNIYGSRYEESFKIIKDMFRSQARDT